VVVEGQPGGDAAVDVSSGLGRRDGGPRGLWLGSFRREVAGSRWRGYRQVGAGFWAGWIMCERTEFRVLLESAVVLN
jgi:hypothetical protein